MNLKNISQTDAGTISFSLKNGEGNKVLLTKAKANIPILKKGQSEKVDFEFILQKALKDKKIDFLCPCNSSIKKAIQNSAPIVF